MADAPVFVAGLPRTGKTPLRMALGSHPSLSMTRKSRMWTQFHGRFGDLSDLRAFDRCLEAMLADPGVARLSPDRDEIRRRFAGTDQTYAELFGLLHSLYAEKMGKPRWGEQMAFLERYVDDIFATWPHARVIHMVRRASDWVVARSQRRPGGVGAQIRDWAESAGLALDNTDRYPDGYRVVQFETLRSDPAGTLAEVGSFIGVEMSEGMVSVLTDALRSTDESGLGGLAGRYVDGRMSRLLAELGYPRSPEPNGLRVVAARMWFGPLGEIS